MRSFPEIARHKEFRFGSPVLSPASYTVEELIRKSEPEMSTKFMVFKTVFDFSCAVVAMPIIAIMSVLLLILNPFFNPGPLFFRQNRVGQFGHPFRMWKFRTMAPAKAEARDPNAKVEEDRISRLGGFLRKTRLDEIPNMINVLRGEMSVVGPRPDAANHVAYYSRSVHGYFERHRIKPGITGLAQVEQGYVEDEDATWLKAKYDNLYVDRVCIRLDAYIIIRTFLVMVCRVGAK